ncbi:unnamed protein product [Gadus morhua 'NCC']
MCPSWQQTWFITVRLVHHCEGWFITAKLSCSQVDDHQGALKRAPGGIAQGLSERFPGETATKGPALEAPDETAPGPPAAACPC